MLQKTKTCGIKVVYCNTDGLFESVCKSLKILGRIWSPWKANPLILPVWKRTLSYFSAKIMQGAKTRVNRKHWMLALSSLDVTIHILWLTMDSKTTIGCLLKTSTEVCTDFTIGKNSFVQTLKHEMLKRTMKQGVRFS